MSPSIRFAQLTDIPVLEALIAESVYALQNDDYTKEQIDGALGTVYGIDRQLVNDQTFFVVESNAEIVACGGWSKRRTAFGSDRSPVKDDALLDCSKDAAKIRGFFVHPSWSRKGLGTLILRTCEDAAQQAGFRKLELTATLTGVALYAAHGYSEVRRYDLDLPNGHKLPVVQMARCCSA